MLLFYAKCKPIFDALLRWRISISALSRSAFALPPRALQQMACTRRVDVMPQQSQAHLVLRVLIRIAELPPFLLFADSVLHLLHLLHLRQSLTLPPPSTVCYNRG